MKSILLSTALVLTPLAASAVTFVIDDFTSTQIVADRPTVNFPKRSEAFGPTVLGGYRDLAVRTLKKRPGPFASTLSSNVDGEELLNFSNQSGQQGIGTLLYNGLGDEGLGGVDLTLDGIGRGFQFLVENADASLTIESIVSDTAGGTSMLEQSFPESIVGERVTFAFADFAGDVDFTSAKAIRFIFSGPADLDASFSLLGVSPIPLPAGGLLLGTGLLGAAALRRRRA